MLKPFKDIEPADDAKIGLIWISLTLIAICIAAIWINGRPRDNDSAYKARQQEVSVKTNN